MTHRLIVNADDYGRTPAVSAGIRAAHLNGIVSSTSTLMNFFSVEEDLHLALQDCPKLGLGVHLVLTSGQPVLPAAEVPSLVVEGVRFPNLAEFYEQVYHLEIHEVEREWRAQLEKFVSITGKKPTHLDSHHHSSYFTPQLFRLMLTLAAEYGCAIRNAFFQIPEGSLAGLPVEIVTPHLPELHELYREFKPLTTHRFVSAFYDENATTEVLLKIIQELPEEPVEMMCHPGYVDDYLVQGSIYNQQRASEIEVLSSETLPVLLAECEVELITYADLQR
jgi:chitin disaccharide deacetylase